MCRISLLMLLLIVVPVSALGRELDGTHSQRSRGDAALMERRWTHAIRALREFEADYAMDAAVAGVTLSRALEPADNLTGCPECQVTRCSTRRACVAVQVGMP